MTLSPGWFRPCGAYETDPVVLSLPDLLPDILRSTSYFVLLLTGRPKNAPPRHATLQKLELPNS
jgi:hypothetical protein